jgi:hypothetical protein
MPYRVDCLAPPISLTDSYHRRPIAEPLPALLSQTLMAEFREICFRPGPDQRPYIVYSVIETPIDVVTVRDDDYVNPASHLFVTLFPAGQDINRDCYVTYPYPTGGIVCVVVR